MPPPPSPGPLPPSPDPLPPSPDPLPPTPGPLPPTALSPEHLAWLDTQRGALLECAAAAVHPQGGFAWLDDEVSPRLERDVELWVTTRMTHVAALARLEGRDGAERLLDWGVEALRGRLRDADYGGWFASVGPGGPVVADKRAYEHAFVVLAGASAQTAGHPDGPALLDDALTTFVARFWREDDGRAVDVWDRRWESLEDYRGLNANMHSVEALIAAADATGDPVWLERAGRVVEFVVRQLAPVHAFRLPEHFTGTWSELPDYHRDQPAHPFRPYGVTIGHLLEWSRLTLGLRAAVLRNGSGGVEGEDWMLDGARLLFDRAVVDGWEVDGREGFVYTTDFDGTPVVRDRLHWVVAEALGAAWTLYLATGEQPYLGYYHRWWDHARRLFIDDANGSWRHELDEQNRPSATVWQGRPDVYHAYQATLIPTLGPVVSLAGGAVVRFT